MTDDRSLGRSFIGRAGRFLRQEGLRAGVGVVGGVVVIVGIVLMPLPGPGLLIVLAGLALLATQFEWARDLLDRLREQARHVLDRWRDGDEATGGSPDDRLPGSDDRLPGSDDRLPGSDDRPPGSDDRRETGSGPRGDRSDVA